MSEENPQVVNLRGSSDLDAFLSEFPSEGPDGPSVVPVDGAQSLEQFAARDAEVAEVQTQPDGTERTQPRNLTTFDAAAVTTGGAASPSPVTELPRTTVEPRTVAKGAFAAKQGTVTEFPVHATRPPTPSTVALVPTPVTLVDLLERQGGLEWRQAVAVIHQICGLLKQTPPHQPILLEPRNILITHEGQVRLLPALSGGDPLVIQLGRLLRTMMTGNDAPPELRLLLAQATFELPIFESVEDVDRALVQLERLEQGARDGKGFMNPIAPPRVETPPPIPERPARSGRALLPNPHSSSRRRSQTKASFMAGVYTYGLRVAAVAIVAAGLATLVTLRPPRLWPSVSPAAAPTTPTIAPATIPNPAPTPQPPVEATSTPPRVPPASGEPAIPTQITISAPALIPVPDRQRGRERRGTANVPRNADADSIGAVESPTARATAPRTSGPTTGTAAVSSRESERRAASLIAQGQTEKAGIVFDALLLSNPLYEPDPTSLTPEALDAFRTSQRNLLPSIAQKNFDRARAALASGDAERALTLGREVAAILDRRIAEPPAHLREQLDDLINTASAVKSQADDIVYTTADRGVVAPRELSRQFPASGPLGVPPHRVGTLEMIIDKDGGVEFVKLHTPLNRYHERMIVSAAKAWRYRPATRNGKPVKYRLTVRINLPESGTDF